MTSPAQRLGLLGVTSRCLPVCHRDLLRKRYLCRLQPFGDRGVVSGKKGSASV